MNRISSAYQPEISRSPEPEPTRLDELAPPPVCESDPGTGRTSGSSSSKQSPAGETQPIIDVHGTNKANNCETKPHEQDEPSGCTSQSQLEDKAHHHEKSCKIPSCSCDPQAPIIPPPESGNLPSESSDSPSSPRIGDHLLTSPCVGSGERKWRPPWERVLRDIQCRIHLGETFCSHMKDSRSGMIGYQYHPSRDIVTKNRHTFHDLLNLYSLLRLYDHEMRCRPVDDIPEPKWSTHGAIWKMIQRGVWYYWEMITPVPIHKHEHEVVEGEGFHNEMETGFGPHHLHHMHEPPTHLPGCSPPLYLCPRRLTRSSHIGHSGMYVLVLCLWHALHRDYDIDEDPSNKLQRMDAIQGLVQGIMKLQRHGGSYKVYFDRFHHTDEGMETYSGVAMYALAMAQQLWEEEMKRTPKPEKTLEEEKKQQDPSESKQQETIPAIVPVAVPVAAPVPIPVPVIIRTSAPPSGPISLSNNDHHMDISIGSFSPGTISTIQSELMKGEEWGNQVQIAKQLWEEKEQNEKIEKEKDKDKENEKEEKEKEKEQEQSPTPTKSSSPSPPTKNRIPPLRFAEPRASPPRSHEWDEMERHKHELDYHSAHPIHGDPTAYSTRDIWHPCGWESSAVEYDITHLLYECEIAPHTWQISVEKAVLAYISYVQNGFVEDNYRVAYACWHSRACSLLVHSHLQILKPEVLIAYVWGINDRIINSGWYDGIIDFAESLSSIEVAYGVCGVIEAYLLLPAQTTYDDDDMHKRRSQYLQCIATSYAFLAMTQRTHNHRAGAYFTARSIGGLVQALQLPLMRIDCTGLMLQALIRLESAIESRPSEFDETFVTQLEAVITHVTM